MGDPLLRGLAGVRTGDSNELLLKSTQMSRDFKDVAAAALELPRSARAELASQLLDSLDDLSEEESDQLWAEEAERRYAAYQSGDMEAVPADEVFARLKRASLRGAPFGLAVKV